MNLNKFQEIMKDTGELQRSLARCSPRGHKESDVTLNNNKCETKGGESQLEYWSHGQVDCCKTGLGVNKMQKERMMCLRVSPWAHRERNASLSKAPEGPRVRCAGSEGKRQWSCSRWEMVSSAGAGGSGVLHMNRGRCKMGEMWAWQHGGGQNWKQSSHHPLKQDARRTTEMQRPWLRAGFCCPAGPGTPPQPSRKIKVVAL